MWWKVWWVNILDGTRLVLWKRTNDLRATSEKVYIAVNKVIQTKKMELIPKIIYRVYIFVYLELQKNTQRTIKIYN